MFTIILTILLTISSIAFLLSIHTKRERERYSASSLHYYVLFNLQFTKIYNFNVTNTVFSTQVSLQLHLIAILIVILIVIVIVIAIVTHHYCIVVLVSNLTDMIDLPSLARLGGGR